MVLVLLPVLGTELMRETGSISLGDLILLFFGGSARHEGPVGRW